MTISTATDLDTSLWAMEPAALRSLAEKIAAAKAAPADKRTPAEERGLEIVDGVAQIDIRGTIVPTSPWWADFFGIRIASVSRIRADLQAALADNSVSSIALLVNSPGGNVEGIDDLAAEIRSARKRKAIHAAVEGTAASAAYWLASQASTISAPRTADVGSIGVYGVAVDMSAAAEAQGYKVHVIRSGPDKGAGVPGAPITDEQLASMQEQIDDLAEIFVQAVSGGRGLPRAKVRELATGRSWLGSRASELGLIDTIETADAAVRRAAKARRDEMEIQEQLQQAQARVVELEGQLTTAASQIAELKAEAEAKAVAADAAYVQRLREKIAGHPTPALKAQADRVDRLLKLGTAEARALAEEMGEEILAADFGAAVPRGKVVNVPGSQSTKGGKDAAEAFASVLKADGKFDVEVDGATVKWRKSGQQAWESKTY